MRHTEIKVGQRVRCQPDGSIDGVVTHIHKRNRHVADRFRIRVQWGLGKYEWLSPGELQAVKDGR